jgi:hypothetical protein
MKRLPARLRAELRILAVWTALLAIGLFLTSLGVTFTPEGASAGSLIAAAWHYMGVALLVSAGVAFLAGAIFDWASAAIGRDAWSREVPVWHPALVLAAPAVCTVRASSMGYVSPETLTYIAATPALGHCGALLARYVIRLSIPSRASTFGSLAIVALTLLCAAGLAPAAKLPTLDEQLAVDHALAKVVPLRHCRHLALEEEAPGLLRDSLRGEIRCTGKSFSAIFRVFRGSSLLAVYSSHRAAKAHRLARGIAQDCRAASGTYIGGWHNGTDAGKTLGTLLCHGTGRSSTIEWSDSRSESYSVVSHPSRSGLYSWWHAHGVSWQLPLG